jgi:hypothetical protein
VLKVPEMQEPPRAGRIQVRVEYRIDPARAEFLALMQESRRSRLRQGALDWQLLHDLYEPGATSSRSSTNPGPSTCAASTASPPPTWRCATSGWPSTSARSRRW